MKHMARSIKHRISKPKIRHAKTKKTMRGNNKKIMVASMVVIGAGLLLWLAWAPKAARKSGPFVLPRVYFVENTPLPADFPKELILDTNVTFAVATVSAPTSAPGAVPQRVASSTDARTRRLNARMGQETVKWASRSSMNSLFSAYHDYFMKNGWTIVSENTEYPNSRAAYATKASSTVSVSINALPSGALVIVSYQAK